MDTRELCPYCAGTGRRVQLADSDCASHGDPIGPPDDMPCLACKGSGFGKGDKYTFWCRCDEDAVYNVTQAFMVGGLYLQQRIVQCGSCRGRIPLGEMTRVARTS